MKQDLWKKWLSTNRRKVSTRDPLENKDPRNEFESDNGRIIFSPAIRRMHDKTQVFPLTLNDNIHTRLTHSLEVAAIGRSLGLRICENAKDLGNESPQIELQRSIPTIVENACLVHDIGNPPFGHFGETAIQNYFSQLFSSDRWKDLGEQELSEDQKEDFLSFDGNAQGFRILTKLQSLDEIVGLNLTCATLASYVKYPHTGTPNKSNLTTKKHGVFTSESEELNTVFNECGLTVGKDFFRHPFAFLMEAADSICYLVMDIEDGLNKSWFDVEDIYKSLEPVAKEFVKKSREGTSERTPASTIVSLRIHLINMLVEKAASNFISNFTDISEGKYDKELIEDGFPMTEVLQTFCQENVYNNREITALELAGNSVLEGLLDYYVKYVFSKNKHYRNRAKGQLSKSILRTAYKESGVGEDSDLADLSAYFKLRVIVDFISGMTDQYALKQYQILSGQATR